MVKTKNLLIDFKRFGMIFDRLSVITLITVNRPDVIVGRCNQWVVSTQNFFFDFKSFEKVLETFGVVT